LISSIIRAHPSLSHILAVGTDGENNFSAAILNNLSFAQQEKMKELGVPKQYQSLFIEDVMWSFHSSHITGLVQ